MTLRELFREFAVANARRRDDANRDVRLAWHIVAIWAMTRSKKRLPPLASLLTRDDGGPSAKEKTNRMRAALEVLSQQYGIPLRPMTSPRPREGSRG